MKTVGIIGGGAGGLCSARHVLATSGMVPIVWEQSSKVGGTWVFTPELGKDKHGLPIHSSMYKNLKTNLPKEVMAFPDYLFPEGEASFLHHTEVCKYLENYTDHFKIRPCIKFNHHVEKVSPVMMDEGAPSWDVTVKNLITKESSTTRCDALLVCNGHYSVPRIPNIKNIDQFKGRKIHSHDYREPFPYKDSTVVVLGAAASGLDICLEIATVAKKVYLSHNHPVDVPSKFPPNVQQIRGVVAASENGFMPPDGSFVEADAIVYCTGYEFSFPFLTKECGIRVEDNIVKPLYKHLIHSRYPSMAFIGIPFLIVPFPLFHYQAQHFIATLTGKVQLPSSEKMITFTEGEIEKTRDEGTKIKYYHRFGTKKQVQYTKETEEEVGCQPLKPYFIQIATVVMMRLIVQLSHFKKYSYKVNRSNDSFVEIRSGKIVRTKLELFWLWLRAGVWLLFNDFFRMQKLIGGLVFRKMKGLFQSKSHKSIKIS